MKKLIFVLLLMTGCFSDYVGDFYGDIGEGTANKFNDMCVDGSEKTKDNVDYICVDSEWTPK